MKNNQLISRHHSDHDILLFECKARVKRTFRVVKSKVYNQEEFAFYYNSFLTEANKIFPKNLVSNFYNAFDYAAKKIRMIKKVFRSRRTKQHLPEEVIES